MTAEIITIGDEILIGQIIDTNSAFISKELTKIGISVRQIVSIEDEKSHIISTLKDASKKVDIVIITGGLGPTNDDVTKHSLCEYFEDNLVQDKDVLEHIEELFRNLKSTPISDVNREQALVPSNATVLFNKYGTAPGMWMEKNNTVFISMPGVPFEMKGLMKYEVLPRLQNTFKRPFIYHKTIRTYGLGESAIAKRIEKWENNLPQGLKLAYLPSLGTVRLRLSGKGESEEELKIAVDNEFEKIYPLLKDIISDSSGEDEEVAVTINKLLTSRGQFLATAESCTGGKIASTFTSNSGASRCFKGAVIPYDTQLKSDILNVPDALIKKYSVVSAEVAEKMAENARVLFKADYAISTTGNAGPDKGDSDAEVGTVFIGIAGPEGVYSKKYVFGKTRKEVVKKAVNKAFMLLLSELV